ncbi:DNA-binding domain-containing protein [Spirochaeta cellobiosiphila]|uniref:HU family DNA-binding protein n=1 Tax=Spirochaeta cellobiosiphila TaxID=504483 RepID=UPI0004104050|nr:DNA-binding domain-containing protein [Spirochaeta cellobiosiphila]
MNEQVVYYETLKNFVNQDRGYRAKVVIKDHLNPEDIIDRMAAKNTTITRQDALAVISLYEEVIAESLHKGYSLSTGIFRASLGMKGNFSEEGESYDEAKHEAHVTLQVAKGFNQKVTGKIKFHKKRDERRMENLTGILDYGTGERLPDDEGRYSITKGSPFELLGHNMKIYKYEGEYSLVLRDGEGRKLALDIVKVAPGKVTSFVKGDVPEGEYELCYVVRYGTVTREYGSLRVRVL